MRGKRVEGKRAVPGGPRRSADRPRRSEASVSKAFERKASRAAAAPAQVRIIGGRWKRTPLPVPDAPGLRPSPDRVRETLFNWLAHLVPDLTIARGLDLFAGTGALGFELASRGAAEVTLVERSPSLAALLLRTRTRLSASMVSVVRGEALDFARAAPPGSFDIVFLDPPFDSDLLRQALHEAGRIVVDGGFVYAESGVPLDASTAAASGLQPVREGRAGQVHFHLLQKA
jgi:16S rRNA (guanine(966)-N(2))-methyltransferase RsmD